MSEKLMPEERAKIIRDAENIREAGKQREAITLIGQVLPKSFNRFAEWPLPDKKLALMAARIFVVAQNSLAKEQEEPAAVVTHLTEARKIIKGVYHDQAVEASIASEDMQTNFFNEPYRFKLEMLRDEASYLVTLAGLTGDESLYGKAVQKLDQVIASSSGDQSASTLADFEKQRLLSRKSLQLPEILTSSFEKAVAASAGNVGRVATIAARYRIDAQRCGNIEAVARADEVYDGLSHSDKTRSLREREAEKAAAEPAKHAHWQAQKREYTTLYL